MAGGKTAPFWGMKSEGVEVGSWQDLQKELGSSQYLARLLWDRGYRSFEDIEKLMKPQLSQLPSPFSIIDLEKAVDRVIDAIANEERIVVYGDYDVDGTCGSSILFEFFREIGVNVEVYQPNRFTEGYGVNSASVETLLSEGMNVLISVDCGITAIEPARICLENGCDYIVLDHHQHGAVLPQAYALVDPQLEEDTSGLHNLCGAGIAFFFVMGLRSKLREAGYFEELKEPNLLKYLDLVAVATIADMVDVRGVNRILVSHGLKVLNKSPRPGIKAVLEKASIKDVKSVHLGFVLGPRINAAGRLETAKAALDLLTTQDADLALDYAEKLEIVNKERRKTQDEVFEEARGQALAIVSDPKWVKLAKEIPAAELGPWPRALVLFNENWHEGVVGIVATKVMDEFKRPVFVLTKKESEEKIFKGSIRSLGKVDIVSVLHEPALKELLENFGGHAYAGGLSLQFSNLEKFNLELNRILALTTVKEHYMKARHIDFIVEESKLSAKDLGVFTNEMDALEPFGMGFPEPAFQITSNASLNLQILKDKHLKFKLAGVDSIWFGGVSNEVMQHEGKISLIAMPGWNEWMGNKKLQFRISQGDLL